MKYKKCCRGKVDWPELLRQGAAHRVENLSARGRNLLFLNAVADALQLDRLGSDATRLDFKRAFTPQAVRKIFEAIPEIWPSGGDLTSLLRREASTTSGLYVGTYDPEVIERGLTRHTLYADSILLADPLLDPRRARAKYNPIEHPEQHRSAALRWVTLWLHLAPWIDSAW